MYPYITEKPTTFTVKLHDTECAENEPVSFVAELNQKVPLQSVKWTHNGEEISPSNKDYSVTMDGKKCVLKIYNATLTNSGQYSISVQGVTSDASLNVKGLYNSVISLL